ncbi:condensation domain-containing protein [Streptomyces microflavus]|uniref:condensation domain-containing protein n=1 Tax=Streptomyces microflavus TaxID=1919 RepID=UPI0038197392
MSEGAGEPERDGPLSRPQLDWFLSWRIGQPDHVLRTDPHLFNMAISATPRRPASVAELMRAVRVMVTRHEATRTRLNFDGGPGSSQEVMAAPRRSEDIERMVRVTDARRAPEVFAEVKRTDFAADEWLPVRVVASTRGTAVREVAMVADHAALDAWGIRVARDDLLRVLEGATPVEQVGQPLDDVAWERSPAGQRQSVRALEFWTSKSRALAEILTDAPPLPATGLPGTDFASCSVASARVLHAARSVSAASTAPVSAVLLAAFAAAVAEVTGAPGVGVHAHAVNRHTEEARNSASNRFMRAPVVLRTRRRTLADLSADAYGQQLRGHVHADVDRPRLEELRAEILPPGASPVLAEAWFNFHNSVVHGTDLLPDEEIVGAPRHRAVRYDTAVRGPAKRRGRIFMLKVKHLRDHVRLNLSWRADVLEDEAAREALHRTCALLIQAGERA